MKTFINFIALFLSLSAFGNEFRFKAKKVSYEDTKSFEEEIVEIGSIKVTRGELSEYAGMDAHQYSCGTPKKSILDNSLFQRAVDISLATTIAHTLLQADKDKQKHAIVGALISAGAVKICEKILGGKDNRLICALTGSGAALFAGIAKEVYDSKGHGTVDAKDAIYTFVPGALVSFKIAM